MITQLIPADHYKTRKIFQKNGTDFLRISEFYSDTIQGEGPFIGAPASFIRLQGCTLNCIYCDTEEVWKHGTPWSYNELYDLMEKYQLIEKLLDGQHLVFTGGSPLLQQNKIVEFLELFDKAYKFLPFVEIENECTILPSPEIIPYIFVWNNSPKLSNSGVPFKLRYNALAIGGVAMLPNSFFKFVVDGEEDWEEIKDNFLEPGFITKSQIILMPMAQTREELLLNREKIVEIAIRHNVRYCSREHIALWDKKIGV
jgi:organic radical activating enzyme